MGATQADAMDEKELRKVWLKQHFLSYEYHEELLVLHQQWYAMIKQALARPEVERDYPEDYKFFRNVAAKNFDSIPLPGQWTREFQRAHRATGAFRSITDYSNIMYPNYWEWMTDEERQATDGLWQTMWQMSTNMRRTADRSWAKNNDNILLNERYTGPIDWPADWREQVLGTEGAALANRDALRIKAGEPVPESGTYVALDPLDRRFTVAAGATLPDLKSAYGLTVWQRIGD